MANNREQYLEKLRDPRWQQKRLVIMSRDEWKCRRCKADDKTLHVHHTFYKAGREPWEYHDNSLVTLCLDCHEGEGEWGRDAWADLREAICNSNMGLADDVLAYAYAFPTHFIGMESFPERELSWQEANAIARAMQRLSTVAIRDPENFRLLCEAINRGWVDA